MTRIAEIFDMKLTSLYSLTMISLTGFHAAYQILISLVYFGYNVRKWWLLEKEHGQEAVIAAEIRRPRNYFILAAIALLIACVCLMSCKAGQTLQSLEQKEFHDSNSVNVEKYVDVNKAVNDSILFYVGKIRTMKPECDSVTNAALDQILRNLFAAKQSGENSYQLRFDEQRRQLQLLVRMAETRNEKKDSTRNREIRTIATINKEIPVERPRPGFEKALIVFGILGIIYLLMRTWQYIKGKIK